MKNILIVGVGRAGKTTLSNLIKKKHPSYNLIHSDCIKWGIIRADGKENYYDQNVEEQKKWEHSEYFQSVLLETYNSCVRNDGNRNGYILESGQLRLKNVLAKVDLRNTIILCLGHGNLSSQGIFELCRNNDKESDWSFEISDDDLAKHVDKWFETNELLKSDCLEYNINYYDTSNNREEVLDNILNIVSKEI